MITKRVWASYSWSKCLRWSDRCSPFTKLTLTLTSESWEKYKPTKECSYLVTISSWHHHRYTDTFTVIIWILMNNLCAKHDIDTMMTVVYHRVFITVCNIDSAQLTKSSIALTNIHFLWMKKIIPDNLGHIYLLISHTHTHTCTHIQRRVNLQQRSNSVMVNTTDLNRSPLFINNLKRCQVLSVACMMTSLETSLNLIQLSIKVSTNRSNWTEPL